MAALLFGVGGEETNKWETKEEDTRQRETYFSLRLVEETDRDSHEDQ